MDREKKGIESMGGISGKEEEKKAVEWEKVAMVFAILFLVILGISSFFHTKRLWGINHLSYYPLWFRALVIFLGFLVFIPIINQSLQRFLKKYMIPSFSFLVEKRKYLGYPIIILLFILFFYLFPVLSGATPDRGVDVAETFRSPPCHERSRMIMES
jgi:hypothetical protein